MTKLQLCLVLLLGLLTASSASAQEWGTLTGRFIFDGDPPKPEPLEINKDLDAFGKLKLVDETLKVGEDGGIANVVVYLRTRNAEVNPELADKVPAKVKYDNKGARFVPRILPLWLEKQTVVLTNSDPVAHNSNVQPLGDEGVNPLLPAGGEFEHTFNRSQSIPVPVGCNIHPWMKGYILPRSNPYFAVSDEQGNFKIEKLPVGELEFQAWQEKCGYLARPEWERGRFTIDIKPGENKLGDVKVPASVFEK